MGEKDPSENNIAKNKALSIPPVVDITRAGEFYSELSKIMADEKNLVLDASKVEKITTPGIQMLMAAAKSMENRGGSFCINDPSESFRNVFSDLGFSEQLKNWNGKNE